MSARVGARILDPTEELVFSPRLRSLLASQALGPLSPYLSAFSLP